MDRLDFRIEDETNKNEVDIIKLIDYPHVATFYILSGLCVILCGQKNLPAAGR